ncbi:hypothetical protein D1BOALGB6SA_9943 [Olavius sp. associated proteobacterium Delta 1]|nr:hypothetical protein D1BOALGB6SA_9943 [Olavius sp. associated proteobacterium Delta 1]
MKKNKKICYHRIKRIIVCLGLALIIAGICMPASVNGADRKVKGEWILPEYYPQEFDGYGYINRIETLEVVIDDSLLRVSPSVTYATLGSPVATIGDFAEGNLVAYLINSEREIISLWLIK